MKRSHPNCWIYGGIIVPVDWDASPARLAMWGGALVDVEQGDTILTLFSGAPAVVLVCALRNGQPVPANAPGLEA